jgi:hypothetical protein
MIALLPVSRHRVEYQTAAGRPYSVFERLLLEAIASTVASLDSLVDMFCVHRRVIIEGLVTLMQAGWVALEAHSNRFTLTKAGKFAVGKADVLPRNVFITKRTDYVVMERVEGQIARGTDVSFIAERQLHRLGLKDTNNAVLIPKGDISSTVEPAMVHPLLRPLPGEWIRWIGPITLVRNHADVVLIDVDTERGVISGLPPQWQARLAPRLEGRVRARERQLRDAGAVRDDAALRKWLRKSAKGTMGEAESSLMAGLKFSDLKLVLGADAHMAALTEYLDRARTFCVINAPSLSDAAVNDFAVRLRAACERGVLVEILWGHVTEEKSHASSLAALRKIEYDTARASGPGKLVVAREPSLCYAGVLVSDAGEDGRTEAILGGYGWLGAQQGPQSLSIRIMDAKLVAQISRILADIAASDTRLASGAGAIRLRNEASVLESEIVLSDEVARDTPLRAKLVTDRDHHSIFQATVSEARRSVVVMSESLRREAGERDITVLIEAINRACTVEIRSRLTSATEADETLVTLQKYGAIVQVQPGLFANVVVIDDDLAVMGSFNWLGESRAEARPNGSDFSLLLHGSGVGRKLLDALHTGDTRAFGP